jgi:hypothetical protein
VGEFRLAGEQIAQLSLVRRNASKVDRLFARSWHWLEQWRQPASRHKAAEGGARQQLAVSGGDDVPASGKLGKASAQANRGMIALSNLSKRKEACLEASSTSS